MRCGYHARFPRVASDKRLFPQSKVGEHTLAAKVPRASLGRARNPPPRAATELRRGRDAAPGPPFDETAFPHRKVRGWPASRYGEHLSFRRED